MLGELYVVLVDLIVNLKGEIRMSRIIIRKDRCKGCLLCTTVCPKELLVQSNEFNNQGFKVITLIDERAEECIGCGFCAEICPDCAITVYRSKKKKENSDERQPGQVVYQGQ